MPWPRRQLPTPVQSNAMTGPGGTPSADMHRWMQGVNQALEAGRGAVAGAANVTQTAFMTFLIEKAQNKDFRVLVNSPVAFVIDSVTTRSSTGTCTLTAKVNTTALGGTANSVSTSEQTQSHSSSNAVSAGDDVVLTISANSACENVSVTIACTLTLAAA